MQDRRKGGCLLMIHRIPSVQQNHGGGERDDLVDLVGVQDEDGVLVEAVRGDPADLAALLVEALVEDAGLAGGHVPEVGDGVADEALVALAVAGGGGVDGRDLDLVARVGRPLGEPHLGAVERDEGDVELGHLVARAPVRHRLDRPHHLPARPDLPPRLAVQLLRRPPRLVRPPRRELPAERLPQLARQLDDLRLLLEVDRLPQVEHLGRLELEVLVDGEVLGGEGVRHDDGGGGSGGDAKLQTRFLSVLRCVCTYIDFSNAFS